MLRDVFLDTIKLHVYQPHECATGGGKRGDLRTEVRESTRRGHLHCPKL